MQKLPKISPYSVTDDVWMVPCSVSSTDYNYLPICRPLKEEDESTAFPRQTWLPEEDEHLNVLVTSRGPRGWSSIARELNLHIHKGKSVRHGKQCRERYYNHLDPYLDKRTFSSDEDLTILRAQAEIGNKWSLISRQLPGRTENQVKNRYKSLLKKAKWNCSRGQDPVSRLILELEALKREECSRATLDDIKPLAGNFCENALRQDPRTESVYEDPYVHQFDTGFLGSN